MRALLSRVDRLQRLAVFESAARLGSFTAAAQELGMTQPAVTRQIRALERQIRVELFTRSANRSQLTELGQRFHSYIASGFDTIEAGLNEMEVPTGTFVLAAHPGIAQQWLVPRIDALHEALGDLELRLWLFDADTEIAGGGFDAAIRVGDGNFAGQSAVALFDEVVVPVASPAFADEHHLTATSTATDVFRAPLVHMDDGDSPWMTWAEWLDRFGIALRRMPGRVLYNNYPMVLQQALAGRGVALGWRTLVDDLIAGDALMVVGPEVRSRRAYYLTWPRNRPSDTVTAVLEWLRSEIDRPTPTP